MAEAPRTALIDVLSPIFKARAEQLAATIGPVWYSGIGR